MTDFVAEEFAMWNKSLLTSASSIRELLTMGAAPVDKEKLQDLFDEMKVDLQQIERLRPTSNKKVTYEFSEALPNIAMALRLAPRVKRLLNPEPTPENSVNASTSHQQGIVQPTTSSRKIPEVTVLPFSGDITTYASFIKSFHLKYDNLSISDAERLQHLKSCVNDEPFKIIGNLDLNDENYRTALKALADQYDNKARVISELYHKIGSLKPAENKPHSLRSVYYELEGLISALSAHGQDVDAIPPLRDQVLCKYPMHITTQVCGNEIPTITEFQRNMSKYIDMRTGVQAAADAVGVQQKFRFERPRATTSALVSSVATVSKEESKRTPDCAFCNHKHYSADCPTVMTLSARKEAVKNRCYLCLNRNHKRNECTRTTVCPYCAKRKAHHKALCPTLFAEDKILNAKIVPSTRKEDERAVHFAHKSSGAHITVGITVINPDTLRPYSARALFDTGSNDSYITETAARRMGLSLGRFQTIPVAVFANEKPTSIRTAPATAAILLGDGSRKMVQFDSTHSIPQTCKLFDYQEFVTTFPRYANYKFAPQAAEDPIEMIIGNDYFWDFISPKEKVQLTDGLYLIKIEFGWTLVGRHSPMRENTRTILLTMKPSQAIDRLCNLDTLGIKDEPLTAVQEEQNALNQFYKNLTFVNNRYQIRWPWREYPPPLPNNYGQAFGRLKTLYRKLSNSLLQEYDAIIRSQIDAGIIEDVPAENLQEEQQYYLPHRPVIAPEKSTSLRIVYDGSAKGKNSPSLNDTIYKGKNLLNDQTALLLRLRFYKKLILADFEKAFHQLLVHPNDRRYVQFLWLRDITKPPTPSNIRYLQFCRVAFGIVASPFLLNATVQYHLENNRNQFTERIKKDLYVDNLCTGVNTSTEAYSLYQETTRLFADCSINLRAWASNDDQLRTRIPALKCNSSEKISILGLQWNQYRDTLSVKPLKPIDDASELTLRKIASLAGSFYDPCGFFRPLSIRATILMQPLRSYDWDDILPKDVRQLWEAIQQDLEAVAREFPRFIENLDNPNNKWELHTFSDGSQHAYACAAYVRAISESGAVNTTLLFSKARIVKLKHYTIPQIELIAAVLATRVIQFIRSAIPIEYRQQILWCDSKCVLHWVRTKRILPAFIQRRVEQMRGIPNISFRYVSSADNPADLPTRGVSYQDLEMSTWFHGPAWINEEARWPSEIFDLPKEIVEKEPFVILPLAVPVNKPTTPFEIPIENYSNYLFVLRITYNALRFLRNMKLLCTRSIFPDAYSPLGMAEKLWLRFEQRNHYSDVYEALENKKYHVLIQKLQIFADKQGFLRCAGRLQNASYSAIEKAPFLLPAIAVSRFSYLLVQYFHILNFHGGTTLTLTSIRREFWIPRGRATVSSIVVNCAQCKRLRANAYEQPTISSLPYFRLQKNTNPFDFVGIDTAGPLYVQNQKRYVLLVTDLIIRAIDLELLEDMTTAELDNAFRRIMARRTQPQFILSDNAKQFKLLRTVLQERMRADHSWEFIKEHSPWMGGAYERLIGLTKGALIRTFHGKALSDGELRTALAEIAGVLNGRPLTYVSEELEDQPLTPSHFLRSYFSVLDAPVMETTRTVTRDRLTSLWKKANATTQEFWYQWSTSYLDFLRDQHNTTNFPKQVTKQQPTLDTVVLIAEKHTKRSTWKIGRIIHLNKSDDGAVRSVDLRTGNGTIITRPVCHLYPLEIPSSSPIESSSSPPEQEEEIIEIEIDLDD
jgi:hypothetical protein